MAYPEQRKIIGFGKSSYVVSLPKSWLKANKLQKGDLVHFDEQGSSLLLSSKGSEQIPEGKQKVILTDGKSIERIGREVTAAYIMNCKEIVLKGKEVKSKIKELQAVIQNLIALEIMEQSSDIIVAKDFLNMDKVSVEELIRKMDLVTRTMFKEARNIFNEDNYYNINERDRDVNRLYFLVYRAVLYNLGNPSSAMKNFNMDLTDLMRMQSYAFHIEAVADEVRRTSRHLRLVKLPPQKKKELEQTFDKFQEHFANTMKSIYTKNGEFALQLSELKKTFNEGLDRLEQANHREDNLNKAINRLRRLNSSIHNLGRMAYTKF